MLKPFSIALHRLGGQNPIMPKLGKFPAIKRLPLWGSYADKFPVGTAGIPPTLLMQDMYHFLPPYLKESTKIVVGTMMISSTKLR
jgi:hypothetical protein